MKLWANLKGYIIATKCGIIMCSLHCTIFDFDNHIRFILLYCISHEDKSNNYQLHAFLIFFYELFE